MHSSLEPTPKLQLPTCGQGWRATGKQETDVTPCHVYVPAAKPLFFPPKPFIHPDRSTSFWTASMCKPHTRVVSQLTCLALAVDGRPIGGRWPQTQHFGLEFFTHVVCERTRCGWNVSPSRCQEANGDVINQLHKNRARAPGRFVLFQPGSMLLTGEILFRVTPPKAMTHS